MTAPRDSQSTQPLSTLRSYLRGGVDTRAVAGQRGGEASADSIIIWPAERTVASDEYQEVTLWQSPPSQPGNVLPVNWGEEVPPAVETTASEVIAPADQPSSFEETIRPADRSQRPVVNTPLSVQPRTSLSRTAIKFILLAIMLLSLVVMAAVVIPDLYYRLLPERFSDVSGNRLTPISLVIELQPTPTPLPTPQLPPLDPSLPTGEHLRIPSLGIDATVRALVDPDEALRQGAWRVPDFGSPEDFTQPTIIASHRYGWLSWWQTDFGRKNSFYYLPEVAIGQQIELISGQRRFAYTIYAKEEGEEISDYSADLILYTCKFLNSPQRYFVYAKRST